MIPVKPVFSSFKNPYPLYPHTRLLSSSPVKDIRLSSNFLEKLDQNWLLRNPVGFRDSLEPFSRKRKLAS